MYPIEFKPVEFQAKLRQNGKITIPKEVREVVDIEENDVVQVTIEGTVTSERHWVVSRTYTELKDKITTCARVQNRYIIRIPITVRKCAGLKYRDLLVIRLEKIIRPENVEKSKAKSVSISKKYVEKFKLQSGNLIQITIFGVNSGKLPQNMRLTVTTRIQKNSAYLPRFVAGIYWSNEFRERFGFGLRVKVDKVLCRN